MIFDISRTDDWRRPGEKPCERAVATEIDTVKREFIFDAITGKQIIFERPHKEQKWQIEINTLEELLALQKEVDYGLIIDNDCIEIYDWYRE